MHDGLEQQPGPGGPAAEQPIQGFTQEQRPPDGNRDGKLGSEGSGNH